ncbi:MAG: hypothetical protein HY646_17895, partial [Acidobacteria bacterium]|nr:hypothetical protein [Acidobacteriota bacterium]
IILRCIEKNPAKRFQSAGELEAALTAKQEVVAAAATVAAEGVELPLPIHLTRWQRSDWLLLPLAVIGLLVFFLLFERISFAPRSQVSFDRGVKRRIAEEYAQKLGAPIGANSQILGEGLPLRYEYVAAHAGAPAALELTNNPVPYAAWRVEWENGTSVGVDNRGSLRTFRRDFPSAASIEKLSIEEAKKLAEKAVRDFLNGDPAGLRSETAGDDVWLGRAATAFTWSDSKDFHGLQRSYGVRLVGRDIASLEINYDIPRGFVRPDNTPQLLPLLAFYTLLFVVGLLQRQFVDLYSRWRAVLVPLITLVAGWQTWLVFSVGFGDLGVSFVIFLVVLVSLAIALLAFFLLVPVERAIRRMAPAKISTFVRLFDTRAASEPCGLGVLRGTLLGLVLLGADTLLVWLGMSHLGMRLDTVSLLIMQGLLFPNNPWPSAQLVVYPLLQSITLWILIAFLTSFLSRAARRPWLAMLLGAALAAAILPPILFIGAVQPYPGRVLLLTLDFLILAWAFVRFDALTLFAAAFTYSFFWETYTMLVTFRPLGAIEEWIAFAVWGLFIAAAAAIAFRPAILSAYRRAASAFQ